jgi:chromosome segregation ATPase
MNIESLKAWSVPVVVAAALAGGGCASNRVVPNEEELARATASIEAAEKAGAFEHGGAELNKARQKLTAAKEAADEGETERAQRLAIEADLDADLAVAKSDNQEIQAAVAELQESIRTLQQELQRSEQQNIGRL